MNLLDGEFDMRIFICDLLKDGCVVHVFLKSPILATGAQNSWILRSEPYSSSECFLVASQSNNLSLFTDCVSM